jgi:DNA-binding NtrC family response regulator
MEKLKILVVDDELVVRESLAEWLREDGHEVDLAASGAEAIAVAAARSYDVFFLDLKMPPGMNGIEAMGRLREVHPEASYVVITAYATVDTAVSAMKEGADEYLVKPCNPEEISLLIERLVRCKVLQRENSYLRKKLEGSYGLADLVGRNPGMLELFATIREVADLRSTVLIEGESGTGKELVARAVHRCSARAEAPFVVVSCAALTETLLESELFGHERGAFTGALARRLGKFEQADGGTIFLDEVAGISPKLQMDLLRVLQERRFYRVGGTVEIAVDVRVIAASNRDLSDLVEQGTFRDDLYYRLNVLSLRVPPLRERRDDIPLLARDFIRQQAAETGKPVRDLTEGALAVLLEHDWPGNVRELENAVARATATSQGELLTEAGFDFLHRAMRRSRTWQPPVDLPFHEVERQVLEAVLEHTGGNIKRSAEILELDRTTVYEKIKKYGLRR